MYTGQMQVLFTSLCRHLLTFVGCNVLSFSKTFNISSYRVLVGNLKTYELDESTVRWAENWLDCQAQNVVINDLTSKWHPVAK